MSYNRQSWPQNIVLQSQANDFEYIVTAAQYGAGILPINGSGGSPAGDFTNGKPAFITITTTADETTNTFTFTGKDQANRTYTVSVFGPNSTTAVLQVPFQYIGMDGISMQNDASGNVSIGISAETATPWILLPEQTTPLNSGANVTLSEDANLTYTIEYTQDYIFGPNVPTNIQPDQNLVDQDANGSTPITVATGAVRMRYSTYSTGYARLQVALAGGNSFKNF